MCTTAHVFDQSNLLICDSLSLWWWLGGILGLLSATLIGTFLVWVFVLALTAGSDTQIQNRMLSKMAIQNLMFNSRRY